MKIDINNISPRQKLKISKGLCDYQYIMDNWQVNDADFQEVYYQFYLKARWAVMSKPGNKIPYFKKLQSISPDKPLLEVLIELRDCMESGCYEFSLGSKLLHTRNPLIPIYDKNVREYLAEEEKLCFWWHRSGGAVRLQRGISELDKIKHDWDILCDWYEKFLHSKKGRQWVEWFNISFPSYINISDIKKVDFIIYASY